MKYVTVCSKQSFAIQSKTNTGVRILFFCLLSWGFACVYDCIRFAARLDKTVNIEIVCSCSCSKTMFYCCSGPDTLRPVELSSRRVASYGQSQASSPSQDVRQTRQRWPWSRRRRKQCGWERRGRAFGQRSRCDHSRKNNQILNK